MKIFHLQSKCKRENIHKFKEDSNFIYFSKEFYSHGPYKVNLYPEC